MSYVKVQKGNLIKSTKYTVLKEQDLIKSLYAHRFHRRISVFYNHGLECSNPLCDRVGTRFIRGRDRGGNIHIDIYTDDLVLMTVDHLVPKSMGGGEELENKAPMCSPCNSKKSNKFKGVDGFTSKNKKPKLSPNVL